MAKPDTTRRDLVSELRAVTRFEYRTVDTRTAAGLEEAERLQAAGWKIVQSGLFQIVFERDPWKNKA